MNDETTALLYYLLFGVAFVFSMTAFAMTSLQKLWLLIVLSSIAYCIYYMGYPVEALWLGVASNLVLFTLKPVMTKSVFNQLKTFNHRFIWGTGP